MNVIHYHLFVLIFIILFVIIFICFIIFMKRL